ncbi:hypothetical protein HJC23_004893 [Cyclotella cryptica]|uniref:Uncharacterized protein n=1 Tax=Cyclotella cryptica TaxID=29204 RepID=A0ABD3P593_9STRA
MKSSAVNAHGTMAPLLLTSSLVTFLAVLYFQIDITCKVVIFTLVIAAIVGAFRMAVAETNCAVGNQRGNPRPLSYTFGYVILPSNPNSFPFFASVSSLNSAVVAARRAFQEKGKAGIIFKNKLSRGCIALEFYGLVGINGKSIEIEFGQSSNLNPTKVFLQGEIYKVIDLDEVTFESFRVKFYIHG